MQNKTQNTNHISMSSIEPANMQLQQHIKRQTAINQKLNPKDGQSRTVQDNNLNRQSNDNQIGDTMVFSNGNQSKNASNSKQTIEKIQLKKIKGFKLVEGDHSNSLLNNDNIDTIQQNQQMDLNKFQKQAFESDGGLQQTGRFESSPKDSNKNSKINLKSKPAVESPEVHDQDFDRLGIQNDASASYQENEMRETSYFKQQTDDEQQQHLLENGNPQSLSELITISNQHQQQAPMPQSSKAVGIMAVDTPLITKSRDIEPNSNDASKTVEASPAQSAKVIIKKEQIKPIEGQKAEQIFKISSRSQMRQRARRDSKRNIEATNESEGGNDLLSQNSRIVEGSIETPSQGEMAPRKQETVQRPNLVSLKAAEQIDADQFMRSHSYQVASTSQFKEKEQQLHIDDDSPRAQALDKKLLNRDPSADKTINEKQLKEIMKINQQNQSLKQVVNVTGNFGALQIQKQQSNDDNHNYSVLKGALPGKGDDDSEAPQSQQQMFTSMSDIGFPQNIHNYSKGTKPALKKRQSTKTGELITADKIQRVMDTQNNWRVRTKTIDEMLHDIHDRIESDPEYIMHKSEQLMEFFLQLLADQNFKIVLNTLNILHMILCMPQQCRRYTKILNNEVAQDQSWGLSNAVLGRHIPQIVKKLADSKNIIRQEAIKCLACVNDIMRSGSKKENNFIALILPYLNNSSNWHIREELLNLLIKCFLKSKDQNEFDSYQILDSVLQLFNDTKEKIRNLALEAIAAFASIGDRTKINGILFQLNVDKEICELVRSRLEYGMFPIISQEGTVEIPYQEQFQNYDVDSVAHSMANQSQVVSQYSQDRRKQSLGGGSQAGYQVSKGRGNSSGRKIVVATANATNQQLGVSHQDEMQAYIQSKRTASANNPNQIEFDPNFNHNDPNFIPAKNQGPNYSYSVGGNKQQREKLLDDMGMQQDLNGSSFLPSLQKVYTDQNGNQYPSNHNDRIVGSSGGPGMGYIGGIAQGNIDPNLIVASGAGSQNQMLMSGGNKRSNKYLHGTPGHPTNYQAHFSQPGTNLQAQFNRGNSGKINSNHNMNNSISNKSPSLFEMSGNVASLFGNETKNGSNNFEQMHRVNQQQMSDIGLNERHEILSSGGMNNSHFLQQTPSQFGHDQSMGYHADAYIPGVPEVGDFTTLGNGPGNLAGAGPQIGITPSPHADQNSMFVHENRRNVAQGHKSSIGAHQHNAYPSQSDSQNISQILYEQQQEAMSQHKPSSKNSRASNRHQREISHAHQQQLGIVQASTKKNQNTFYSDGTTFTGITAATGATSQHKGNQKKLQQQDPEYVINSGGHGPIRATRAALGGLGSAQGERQELCIDNRKTKSSSQNPTAKMKVQSKMNGSGQGIKQLKRDESNDSNRMFDQNQVQNRSFSHNKNNQNSQSKELQSAGMAQRQGYLGAEAIGVNEGVEDPALLTQSSKISYPQYEDLEPIEKPEKQYKKTIQKNHGIYSEDWADQFEACNIIRRVCKHHQSLILQTGNSLQSLVNTLIKLADSLRSAVSRIALMALTEMFQALKRVMEPCLLSIVKILIKRGSDTNHFIAEEADKCLAIMVQSCQESKVLQILQMQNMNSRSNAQRLKFCQCLFNIVKQLDNNILFFKENDKLLVQLAKYLQDASQDVRQQAKAAFVAMSQAIMGQNELEKLLQRVLNEVQYRKVKEYLDKEPTHLVAKEQIDFVITNANNQDQEPSNRVAARSNSNKQSFKSLQSLRYNAHTIQKQSTADQEGPLSIQAKSILNPSLAKQESTGFLGKVAQQSKGQPKKEEYHQLDQFFIDNLKDIILRTQVNEWRLRLESSEQLFELIRNNMELFNKNFKMVELADAICKLLNDANAKIQIFCLENFNKIFHQIFHYIEKYMHLFYKSIITNLGSSNLGVRKISEQILKQINDSSLLGDKTVLMQPLLSMIQYNSNIRLKPALIDQLIDLLDHVQDKQILVKSVLPLTYKLLDDSKNEVKQRVERLLRKLYSIPTLGQTVVDSCPQNRLQKVCDICLKNGNGSTNTGAGSGNQIHLNSLAFK